MALKASPKSGVIWDTLSLKLLKDDLFYAFLRASDVARNP